MLVFVADAFLSLKTYKAISKYYDCWSCLVKMSNDKKGMTKDRLVGMQVINSEGNMVGTVNDLAFTVGKLGMTLIVESKKGDSTEIAWEDIQAAGDFIILKAKSGQTQAANTQQSTQQQPAAQAQSQTCPTCGGPLTFIPQYNRWYCYKDKKYV